MNAKMRPEVQEYLRACQIIIGLADQPHALTVEESQAIACCSREVEKKLFADPQDGPAAETLSHMPRID